MTDELIANLRKVTSALAPHNPIKAAADRCNCLPCRTRRLVTTGWPATTVGDEIRSTSPASATERAAGTRDPFTGLDERLATRLNALRADAAAILAIAAIVDSHAGDDDPLPAGSGPCQRCPHICRPDRRGTNDRIRSGWCPACHRRYKRIEDRAGYKPDRAWFNRATDDDLDIYDPPAEPVEPSDAA